MIEKIFETRLGVIHYWVNAQTIDSERAFVFLPGLTADHRLFEPQLAYFSSKYRVLVWDAPGHGASYPFELSFQLSDKAKWLDQILTQEGIEHPVIVGQSMGGYVGQVYAALFPEKLCGFVAIDSAPLQRKFTTGIEIWLLKHMEPVYRYYPWKWLMKSAVSGVSKTAYGRQLMQAMIQIYADEPSRYIKLAGHGMRILGEAMEADFDDEIRCPALLICGEKDQAGSSIRYNKAWHKATGFPLIWVKDAGHNANTDAPEFVNTQIEKWFCENV